MSTPTELAARITAAYNAKDFDAMKELIHEDLDFAHFNRGGGLTGRDTLINSVLKPFGENVVPDRSIEEPERILESGNTVAREVWFSGTPTMDVPGMGKAGETFRLKVCSVMTFNDDGLLVEWKDYG